MNFVVLFYIVVALIFIKIVPIFGCKNKSMNHQIFVMIPSTTPYPNNTANKFTVQLPKTLDLSSGNYVCGLHSISYVYSWPQLGTLDDQWLEIYFKDGLILRFPVPKLSFETPEQLANSLSPNIKMEVEKSINMRNLILKKVKRNVDHYEHNETQTPIEPEKAPEPIEPEKTSYIHILKAQDFVSEREAIEPEKALEPIDPEKAANINKENINYNILDGKETTDAHISGIHSPKKIVERSNISHIFKEVIESTIEEAVKPLPITNFTNYTKKADNIFRKMTKRPKKGEEFLNNNTYFPEELSDNEIRDYIHAIKFVYLKEINKFKIEIGNDDQSEIEHLSFSPQLGYVLGFENTEFVRNNEVAKYSIDMKAGINSFGVYVKGLTENIICGNQLVSLLRVVTLDGKSRHGDTVEKIYDTPIFLKVQPKFVNTIDVELRTLGEDGRLLPFEYGQTIIVLLFKRIVYF